MSAAMVKVGLYGLIRVSFEMLAPGETWWALLLMALGGLSAVMGVLYALMERDIKRILAFSTVENVRIVAVALGVALAFRADGQVSVAAAALVAGLLHAANHAWFKALLFLGTGSIQAATHTLNLDRLGGLARRMPVTGASLLVGGLALPFIIVQHDIKRMLAYSSVEHMGIIALAVGIGGSIGLYAAMLHLVAHSLTKSSLFMAAGVMVQTFNTRSMHRMNGVLSIAPFSGAILLVGIVGLAGLPPFAMFTSEYGLVAGAFTAGHGVIGVAGLLLIALAASSLLYHIVQVSYGQPRPGKTVAVPGAATLLSISLPLVILVVLSIAPPGDFESALRDAATVIGGEG